MYHEIIVVTKLGTSSFTKRGYDYVKDALAAILQAEREGKFVSITINGSKYERDSIQDFLTIWDDEILSKQMKEAKELFSAIPVPKRLVIDIIKELEKANEIYAGLAAEVQAKQKLLEQWAEYCDALTVIKDKHDAPSL